jgi:hypothetical protein
MDHFFGGRSAVETGVQGGTCAARAAGASNDLPGARGTRQTGQPRSGAPGKPERAAYLHFAK